MEPKLNIELMKKLRDRIADENRVYDQTKWWTRDFTREEWKQYFHHTHNFTDHANVEDIAKTVHVHQIKAALEEGTCESEGKHFCGTPCCLAGHTVEEIGEADACAIADSKEFKAKHGHNDSFSNVAAFALGLTEQEANILFEEEWVDDNTDESFTPTREQALKVLDTIIEFEGVLSPYEKGFLFDV